MKIYYTSIASLFNKNEFSISNHGGCKGSEDRFITLRDKTGKRVVTFISHKFKDGNYSSYNRRVLYYTYDKKIDFNSEVEIYGRKFKLLDKQTKRGDYYIIKADTNRLVGFCDPMRKVIKFTNVCL